MISPANDQYQHTGSRVLPGGHQGTCSLWTPLRASILDTASGASLQGATIALHSFSGIPRKRFAPMLPVPLARPPLRSILLMLRPQHGFLFHLFLDGKIAIVLVAQVRVTTMLSPSLLVPLKDNAAISASVSVAGDGGGVIQADALSAVWESVCKGNAV